jgi:hypothetical protein
MIYLMVFLHMLNIGVQVETCVCEVIWRVNNDRKLVIFCDVLYHLNIIFLQHVFEALKRVFSYSKSIRKNCMYFHIQ